MPLKEERSFSAEIRAIADESGKPRRIAGKPAVYNVLSEDFGGWRERILPGCFTKTLAERNVKALWNHDSNIVLGSRKSGNLTCREDPDGLAFECLPPDTQTVRDLVLTPIDRGDVDQMSFMFRTIKDRWIIETDQAKGTEDVVRELIEAELYEVSPVTFPAYPQTSVGLRDAFGTEDREEIRKAIRARNGEPLGAAATISGKQTHGTTTEPPLPASASVDGKHSAGADESTPSDLLERYARLAAL